MAPIRRTQGAAGSFLRTLRTLLPGLDTALGYQRAWLWPDIRAGLILSALLVPAGMGYAQAAGLPAYTGLYATIIPLLAYAIFGPSRILVIGPDSGLAPLIAVAVLPLALGNDDRAVALAGLLAIMVGVILIAAGGLRLGFVTDLLSKPIRRGYLNGIALIVIISQLPKLLGFSIESTQPLDDLWTIGATIARGGIEPLAAVFGIGALAVIWGFKFLLKDRIPGVLVAVVTGILLTAILGLSEELSVVGNMPQGFPAPALGGIEWSDVLALAAPALAIALIAFADTGVLSRTLASRRGETVSGSREMVGLGMANVAGGVMGGFPIAGSMSRTPVIEAAGARSQLAAVVGALLVLGFMLFLPGVTEFLPESVLAAVVIVAISSVFQPTGVGMWKIDRWDSGLAIAAFLGVLLVGVLEGILIAIGLSFVAFVWHSWRPYRAELGRIPGRRGYHDRSRNPEAERIPGIVIVRWDASLFFANANIFASWVRGVLKRAEREAPPAAPAIHTVMVAAEPITDIDTTAMDELVRLDEYLQTRGITLLLAELKGPVRDLIHRHGLGDRFTPDRFPPTVGAAVDSFTGELRTDISTHDLESVDAESVDTVNVDDTHDTSDPDDRNGPEGNHPKPRRDG
ncbi:SulP family inorganic anion transporter [Leucobacter sp. W1478]|uniref:SulP family inorganic anion transporter n=1 Tax=Leucobacter sp. W1478 TaxID=3439065 RepID=UPI003F2F2771